jgi:hypothetical protein
VGGLLGCCDHFVHHARPGRAARRISSIGARHGIRQLVDSRRRGRKYFYYLVSATSLGAVLLASYDLFSLANTWGGVSRGARDPRFPQEVLAP